MVFFSYSFDVLVMCNFGHSGLKQWIDRKEITPFGFSCSASQKRPII